MTYLLVIIPLMIFVWPRFDRTLWIQFAFCVLIGWWLMMVTIEAEIGETFSCDRRQMGGRIRSKFRRKAV